MTIGQGKFEMFLLFLLYSVPQKQQKRLNFPAWLSNYLSLIYSFFNHLSPFFQGGLKDGFPERWGFNVKNHKFIIIERVCDFGEHSPPKSQTLS
jgi:hypothetical protein